MFDLLTADTSKLDFSFFQSEVKDCMAALESLYQRAHYLMGNLNVHMQEPDPVATKLADALHKAGIKPEDLKNLLSSLAETKK